MPILPDDTVDPELQDLVGGSSLAEVARSLHPTLELVIDEDPLVELPFGTEDPPIEIPFEKVQTDIVSRIASESAESPKAAQSSAHNALLRSPHRPALKMLIDTVRKNTALRKIRSSDSWDRLLDSMTRYVEAQVAAGGA